MLKANFVVQDDCPALLMSGQKKMPTTSFAAIFIAANLEFKIAINLIRNRISAVVSTTAAVGGGRS